MGVRAATHIKTREIKGERQVQNIEQKTKEIDFEIWGNCGFFLDDKWLGVQKCTKVQKVQGQMILISFILYNLCLLSF